MRDKFSEKLILKTGVHQKPFPDLFLIFNQKPLVHNWILRPSVQRISTCYKLNQGIREEIPNLEVKCKTKRFERKRLQQE